MMRAVLSAITLAVWAAITAGAVWFLTPGEESVVVANASSELESTTRSLSGVASDLAQQMLGEVRESSAVLRPGVLLERLDLPAEVPPVPFRRKPKTPPNPDALSPELGFELMQNMETDLATTLLHQSEGPGRWFALVNKKGRVAIAGGEGGFLLDAGVKNHPLVVDALLGISRAGAISTQKGTWLAVSTPATSKDGAANGALIAARPIDKGFCADLSAALGQAPVLLSKNGATLCKVEALSALGTAPVPIGLSFLAQSLTGPSLLFVDSGKVGLALLTVEHAVPVLDATSTVAKDVRPQYMKLGDWQQRLALYWLVMLLPLALLLVLASVIAARPAQSIANHLALLLQGGKTSTLSERRYSGGFKRIVKNLNQLLERRDQRGGQTLQPISALLATQGGTDGGQEPAEFRFEPQPTVHEELTAQRKIDPAQLAALRDSAKGAGIKTPTPAPPLQPMPTPAPPPEQMTPKRTGNTQNPLPLGAAPSTGSFPLTPAFPMPAMATPQSAPPPAPVSPPPSRTPPPGAAGLSSLSDAIFDDSDKTVMTKLSPADMLAMRTGLPKPMPPPPPPPVVEDCFSEAALEGAQPLSSTIASMSTLSDDETDGALSGLASLAPSQSRNPAPFPPAPFESPWPEPGLATQSLGAPASAPAQPLDADPDEAHFQEVFQQFLKVREQCGEQTSNLTYDKFVEKLKKSREQVMQKQNTRNVRFQVYVKDGKAALKAVAAR